jgi:hypothetical protein
MSATLCAQADGWGVMTWGNGTKFMGEWKVRPVGASMRARWRPRLMVMCAGYWQDNKRHGRGRMEYLDGSSYDGEWKVWFQYVRWNVE